MNVRRLAFRMSLFSAALVWAGCASTSQVRRADDAEISAALLQPNPVAAAESMMAHNRWPAAVEVLTAVVERVPEGWQPMREEDGTIKAAFWDRSEQECFMGSGPALPVEWVPPSYSKAHYLMAYMALEGGKLDEALEHVDMGLSLEPDHPVLLNEKGNVLNHMRKHEEALVCFTLAETAREWQAPQITAQALRGQGVALIDLGRLDEAEACLRKSLELAPNNPVALNELRYIEKIRLKSAKPGAPLALTPVEN